MPIGNYAPTVITTAATCWNRIIPSITATGGNSTVWFDIESTTGTNPVYFDIRENTCTPDVHQYLTDWTNYVVDVDQEDWDVNQQLYYEWARGRAVNFRIRTAEQRRLEEERVRAERERYRREQQAKDAAKEKSRLLLLSHLRADQQKTFQENKWFVVEGGKSKSRYRIKEAIAGNIEILDKKERVTHRLCVHGSYDLPVYDHMLSQKIMLQYHEDHILKIANKTAA